MPYANHQGVRIHYQVHGNGPPLVLQHSFTNSLEVWHQFGYIEALRENYTCILLDARGHGASDKPHTPTAYTLSKFVGDVVTVLDALDIPQAHFFGYSMGGWIGFGMAKYAPERVTSLIIGGAHPYADRSWHAFRQADGTDADAFIAALETVVAQKIHPSLRPYILTNDLQALTAAAQERPSLEDVLPRIAIPCLLLVGAADARYTAVQNSAQQIAQATFVSLSGLNHTSGFTRSDLVLPQVTDFLASITVKH